MAEFDFAQIVQWLGNEIQVSGKVRGFKQNSREVLPGDLFFALKGEKVDGHDYLKEAAASGAIGAVVSKDYWGEEFGLKLIKVENVIESLQKLAKTVHARRSVRVIGVTGSVGKTTTKEFIATLLEAKFRVGKTPGNANSQVGVPLSILNSEGSEEIFVMEMGMSLPHEIERLIDIAPPEVSIITKIALAHVAFFPDGLEGIAAAKAEILSHPKTRLGILNHQVVPFTAMQKSNCLKMTFGLESEAEDSDFILCSEGANFYAKEKGGRIHRGIQNLASGNAGASDLQQAQPFAKQSMCKHMFDTASCKDEDADAANGQFLNHDVYTSTFALPFTASHLCENFIGAASVARAMGMHWSEIIPQALKLTVYMRRFETVQRNGIVFINDSYNANLTSMKAALANLPMPAMGRKKIAVLGAMKELGEHTEKSHYEVAKMALSHIDYLLCLGEECDTMVELFQREGRMVEHFLEFDSIKRRVFEVAEEGDVVLLKGSNSKRLWQILE